jgi:hypothetical protein
MPWARWPRREAYSREQGGNRKKEHDRERESDPELRKVHVRSDLDAPQSGPWAY